MRGRVLLLILLLSAPFIALAVAHRRPAPPAGSDATSFDLARGPVPTDARFLIVGGGGEPDSSEVQLESDVSALRRVLRGPGVTLFGAGPGRISVRSLRRRDATPSFRDALGELFLPRDRASTYRQPRFHPDGPSTYERVTSTLSALLAGQGDPVLVVLAGHGSPAEDPGDAFALLWGNDGLFVHDVVDLLQEQGARARPTRWVVGTCHGGAFAALGEPGEGDVALHCGFFATEAERLATGCDADAQRRAHQGYIVSLARFLAQPTDLDGDGHPTLEDAHLAALRDLDTFDVPIRTSDRFLDEAVGELGLEIEPPTVDADAGVPAVPSASPARGPATPEETVVLPVLLERAGVRDEAAVLARYDDVTDRLEHLEAEVEDARAMRDVAWNRLRVALLERHPWLEDAYAPGWEARLVRHRGVIEPLLLHSDLAEALAVAEETLAALEVRLDRASIEEARLARSAAIYTRSRARAALSAADPARFRAYEALRACEAFAPATR